MKDYINAYQPATMCMYQQCGLFCRRLTTCLADMMVQMKIPADTKAIDRYLLAEYLQRETEREGGTQVTVINMHMRAYCDTAD